MTTTLDVSREWRHHGGHCWDGCQLPARAHGQVQPTLLAQVYLRCGGVGPSWRLLLVCMAATFRPEPMDKYSPLFWHRYRIPCIGGWGHHGGHCWDGCQLQARAHGTSTAHSSGTGIQYLPCREGNILHEINHEFVSIGLN